MGSNKKRTSMAGKHGLGTVYQLCFFFSHSEHRIPVTISIPSFTKMSKLFSPTLFVDSVESREIFLPPPCHEFLSKVLSNEIVWR